MSDFIILIGQGLLVLWGVFAVYLVYFLIRCQRNAVLKECYKKSLKKNRKWTVGALVVLLLGLLCFVVINFKEGIGKVKENADMGWLVVSLQVGAVAVMVVFVKVICQSFGLYRLCKNSEQEKQ
ncbi:MAG: hypothetical protein FWD76_00285 [Firmicutes bacterium]|nr:hypothetical protein [Bacillota bacterium]